MLNAATETEKIVAILHDTVEDTKITIDQLKSENFSSEIIAAIELLTHNPSVPYEKYIEQIANNPLARNVKLLDLKDNLNLLELPELRDKDLNQAKKYHRAFKTLDSARMK